MIIITVEVRCNEFHIHIATSKWIFMMMNNTWCQAIIIYYHRRKEANISGLSAHAHFTRSQLVGNSILMFVMYRLHASARSTYTSMTINTMLIDFEAIRAFIIAVDIVCMLCNYPIAIA